MEPEVQKYLDSLPEFEREWLERFVPFAEAMAKLEAHVDAIIESETKKP